MSPAALFKGRRESRGIQRLRGRGLLPLCARGLGGCRPGGQGFPLSLCTGSCPRRARAGPHPQGVVSWLGGWGGRGCQGCLLQRGGLDSSFPIVRGAEALRQGCCCCLSREAGGLPVWGWGGARLSLWLMGPLLRWAKKKCCCPDVGRARPQGRPAVASGPTAVCECRVHGPRSSQ